MTLPKPYQTTFYRTGAGAPTVTDDNTKYIDVGATWINTLTNDAYRCTSNATGAAVWVLIAGSVVGPGVRTLISSTTVTVPVSAVTFTSLNNAYKNYEIEFYNVLPVANAVTFRLHTSSNNGISYDTGADDYCYTSVYSATSIPAGDNRAVASSEIPLTGANDVNNTPATGGILGKAVIIDPSNAAYTKKVTFQTVTYIGGGTSIYNNRSGAGIRDTNNTYILPVNAVRLSFNGTNIASGEFRLYGVN